MNNVVNDDNSDRGAGHSSRIDSYSQDNYDAYQEDEDGYTENQHQSTQGSKKQPWGCQAVNDSNVGSVTAEFVGDWAEWSEQQYWDDKDYVGEWKANQVRALQVKEKKQEVVEKEKKKENYSPAPTKSVGLFVGRTDASGSAIKEANRRFGLAGVLQESKSCTRQEKGLHVEIFGKPAESASRNEQPLQ